MNNHTLIFIGIALLMGCATGPKEIQVANNQQLVNFDNVSDDSVGKIVKCGGVITDLQ